MIFYTLNHIFTDFRKQHNFFAFQKGYWRYCTDLDNVNNTFTIFIWYLWHTQSRVLYHYFIMCNLMYRYSSNVGETERINIKDYFTRYYHIVFYGGYNLFWHNGRMFLQTDEFSHWGLVVKNMFKLDVLVGGADTNIIFKDYPPATGVFQILVPEYLWWIL